jgi:hypothetical protein
MTATIVGGGQRTGRIGKAWSYPHLFSDADLVIIAAAETSRDNADVREDEMLGKCVGVDTTFKVLHRVKGKEEHQTVTVAHFRQEGSGRAGPPFVNFQESDAARGKVEYLLFLTRMNDGRYRVVSGEFLTIDGVREIRWVGSRGDGRTSEEKNGEPEGKGGS